MRASRYASITAVSRIRESTANPHPPFRRRFSTRKGGVAGRSGRTAAGDAIRARYRERLEARAMGGDALERVLQKQDRERRRLAVEALKQKERQPKRIRWSALTREERNQRRRERYAANRGIRAQRTGASLDRQPSLP